MTRLTLLLALAAFQMSAGAQPAPAGPPVPPAEELATIEGLTSTQQLELRKIFIERRNAHEQLATKERTEHERIDDQTDERLRKLLGDEGYRKFAQWQIAHRGPPRGGAGQHPQMPAHGGRPGGPGGPDNHGAAPDGAAPPRGFAPTPGADPSAADSAS